jgi:YggT family protein
MWKLNRNPPMLALISTIDYALNIYTWIIIASAVFSWLYAFNIVNARNPFVASVGDFLYKVTEPVLKPIRRLLPDLGSVDISPIVLFILIYFIRQLLWTSIAPLFMG